MAKKAKENEEQETNDVAAAHEENQNAPAPEKSKKGEKPKGEFLASSGDQWKFTENETPDGGPIFVGVYTGRQWSRDKDLFDKESGELLKPKGDVMGYYFTDKNGDDYVIGNSHQIQKSIAKLVELGKEKGTVLYIEFLGKKQVGAKQVNQFDVIWLTDKEELEKYGF